LKIPVNDSTFAGIILIKPKTMKKGKVVPMPTSPEAQIRTRARNLPVDRCYIDSDWEETQMANVVVTRKHVNGNITFGFYLVDLMLLGVKDCFFVFNGSPEELYERINNDYVEFLECDYALAHNIIYGGIAFAKDCGFEPVKSFTKTGIYILEEDSGNIPEMDIPLGEDGVPVVFVTPGESRKREIAILEKTAGPGNFIVYNVDEEGNIEDDGDDNTGLLYEYEDVAEEVFNTGLDSYAAKHKDDMSPVQMLALTDIAHQLRFGNPDFDKLAEIKDLILDDERFDYDLERLPGVEPYIEELQSIIDKMVDDEDAALAEMEALTARYPDEPDLGVLHINMLRDLDLMPAVEQQTRHWYGRAGSHYAIRLLYAEWLVEQERYDEMFELLGERPGLDALTTENMPFTEVMVAEFCACYTLAWLAKNNIEKAEPYYRILIELDNMTSIVKNALLAMMAKKKDALIEKMQGKD
jgi:hypothetical protein